MEILKIMKIMESCQEGEEMSRRPSEAFFGLGRFIPAAIRYIKGDTGARGPQGPAATIEAGAVTTLPPGSPATVTNTGTPNAAVFAFGIPQGDPGTSIPLPVSIANGGTGATTAAAARANLGAMSATADGNTILTGGTAWDRAPIGFFADGVTREVHNRLELAQAAEPYDETKTYHAGDLCTHDGNLYVCGTETTGPWNITYWTVTNLADAIAQKQDIISDLATIRSGAAAGATAVQPSAMPSSETWTFTVDDGQGGTTTVTKQVAVYAAQQGAGA